MNAIQLNHRSTVSPSYCLSRSQWLTIGFLFVILFVAGQHDFSYSAHYDEIMQMSSGQLVDVVDAGSIMRRISFAGLLVCGIFILFRTWRDREYSNVLTSNLVLACFVGFGFLSVLWSSDPGLTIRRASEYLILCIGAAAIGRILGSRGTVWLGFLGSTGYLLIGLICELALGTFHPLSFDYRFCGTLHPNHQAWNCTLLLISGSTLLPQMRRFWRAGCLLAMTLGAVCLFLTKSRTSLVCATLALTFYWAGSLSNRQKLRVVFVCGTLLVTILFATSLVDSGVLSKFDRLLLAGRDEGTYQNFSGRIPLWELCMEYVGSRPVAGYGFESFWTEDHIRDISAQEGWTVPISHNGFIELMLSVGVIGLALYLFQLASTWWMLRNSYEAVHNPFVRFFITLFVFYFLCMFTEAIAFDVGLPTFCFLTMLWSRKQFAPVPTERVILVQRLLKAYQS